MRNIAGPVYTIQEDVEKRVVGTIDEISALSQLHDHAVYLHGAETYFVDRLDLEEKIAFVKRRDLDCYTQAVTESQIQTEEKEEEEAWRDGLLGYGDVTVTTTIPMFKKIRFHSRDSLGFRSWNCPADFWRPCPCGLRRPRRWWTPAMSIGTPFILHDRFPGGMGYPRRCLDRFGDLLETAAEAIRNCGCEDGCPSCVVSAVPPFAMTDIDSSVRGRIPNEDRRDTCWIGSCDNPLSLQRILW